MPTGIARSPFIRPMADALGMQVPTLRNQFIMEGWKAPYLDEKKAISILQKRGLAIDKYLAWRAKHPGRLAASNGPYPRKPDNAVVVARAEPAPVQGDLPLLGAWDRKLVPRLARLLPEGNTLVGKAKVRKILRDGGDPGPKWDDEAKALRIFQQAGIPTTNFVRVKDTRTQVPVVREPTTIDAPPAIENMDVGKLRELVTLLEEQLDARDEKIKRLNKRHTRMSELLNSANVEIAEEFKDDSRSDLSAAEGVIYIVRKIAGTPV